MSQLVIDLESIVKTARSALQDLDPAIRGAIAEEVGQRLCRKVLRWRDKNLAWRSARNEAISILRERKWEIPVTLLQDADNDEDFLDNRPALNRAEREESLAPLSVREARLRATYGNGNKHACQAIVHAYYFLLGYSHTEIVGELAEQSLEDLAQSFVSSYARSSAIPRHRLPPPYSGTCLA